MLFDKVIKNNTEAITAMGINPDSFVRLVPNSTGSTSSTSEAPKYYYLTTSTYTDANTTITMILSASNGLSSLATATSFKPTLVEPQLVYNFNTDSPISFHFNDITYDKILFIKHYQEDSNYTMSFPFICNSYNQAYDEENKPYDINNGESVITTITISAIDKNSDDTITPIKTFNNYTENNPLTFNVDKDEFPLGYCHNGKFKIEYKVECDGYVSKSASLTFTSYSTHFIANQQTSIYSCVDTIKKQTNPQDYVILLDSNETNPSDYFSIDYVDDTMANSITVKPKNGTSAVLERCYNSELEDYENMSMIGNKIPVTFENITFIDGRAVTKFDANYDLSFAETSNSDYFRENHMLYIDSCTYNEGREPAVYFKNCTFKVKDNNSTYPFLLGINSTLVDIQDTIFQNGNNSAYTAIWAGNRGSENANSNKAKIEIKCGEGFTQPVFSNFYTAVVAHNANISFDNVNFNAKDDTSKKGNVAIHAVNSNITLNNSNIYNCDGKAFCGYEGSETVANVGGAIRALQGSKINFNSGKIFNCTAEAPTTQLNHSNIYAGGGAIFLNGSILSMGSDSSDKKCTIAKCGFINNRDSSSSGTVTAMGGGAIFMANDSQAYLFGNCVLGDESATSCPTQKAMTNKTTDGNFCTNASGFAIYNNNCNLYVGYKKESSNAVKDDNASIKINANYVTDPENNSTCNGAIYSTSSNTHSYGTQIYKTEFTGNYNTALYTNVVTKVVASKFSHNTSCSFGGAIYCTNTTYLGESDDKDSINEFQTNIATTNMPSANIRFGGGAVYANNCSLLLYSNTFFSGNQAKWLNKNDVYGSAILQHKGTLNIGGKNHIFSGNKVYQQKKDSGEPFKHGALSLVEASIVTEYNPSDSNSTPPKFKFSNNKTHDGIEAENIGVYSDFYCGNCYYNSDVYLVNIELNEMSFMMNNKSDNTLHLGTETYPIKVPCLTGCGIDYSIGAQTNNPKTEAYIEFGKRTSDSSATYNWPFSLTRISTTRSSSFTEDAYIGKKFILTGDNAIAKDIPDVNQPWSNDNCVLE